MTLPGAMPRVAVCIATFRRPEGLSALLASLGALAFSRRAAEVVVVAADNDARESARGVCREAAGSLPWPLHYVVEAERNIAGARNRAVARALEAGADFVAFVDDDETVSPEWLDELLDAQAASGADVVQGRVVPCFQPGTPAWLSGAWVYGVSLPARGTRLPVASTNNVLVRAGLLAGGRPFDPAFGLSGGEDSLFFLRAAREGALIVSAPAAVACEHVSPARARVGWVLRRAFRGGNTALHCEYALPRSTRAPAGRLARATLRMGASVPLLPLSVLRGRG
ncbi:glycosyltransferase family 2 protein [Longimicrobium sp.]|uniref:glycosyltransferase family 2 protein n=1 Tax=Longimicrobium sp. TaxID=2029185 RepID=UPI002F924715